MTAGLPCGLRALVEAAWATIIAAQRDHAPVEHLTWHASWETWQGMVVGAHKSLDPGPLVVAYDGPTGEHRLFLFERPVLPDRGLDDEALVLRCEWPVTVARREAPGGR